MTVVITSKNFLKSISQKSNPVILEVCINHKQLKLCVSQTIDLSSFQTLEAQHCAFPGFLHDPEINPAI